VDLASLLDPSGAGWRLREAVQINNAGQIVCAGVSPQGFARACVLTPSD
jgi:hypothetical protein